MTPEIEISQAALDSLSNCLLVDIRDDEQRRQLRHAARGRFRFPRSGWRRRFRPAVPGDQKIVLYCTRGLNSVEAAPAPARKRALEAYSLEGGYAGWLLRRNAAGAGHRQMQPQIEEGIRKTWHKRLFLQIRQGRPHLRSWFRARRQNRRVYFRRQGFHAHGQAVSGAAAAPQIPL